MSVVLYVLAALAVMVGTATIGIGVPIKEFGIGNTLILAGTIVLCSGLVLLGLAVAAAQLQRLAELLTARPASREPRTSGPLDRPESTPVTPPPGADRIPFPPKPRPQGEFPPPSATPFDFIPPPKAPPARADAPPVAEHPAPSLRNPVLTAALNEGVRNTIPAPVFPPPPPAAAPQDEPLDSPLPAFNRDEPAEPVPPPPLPPRDSGRKPFPPPTRPPQPSYFDSMWPRESRPAKGIGDVERAAPKFAPPPPLPPTAPPPPVEAPPPPTAHEPTPETAAPDLAPEPANDAEAPAILKSGVVDGMAYTLYVDGSIEAELPQGTLRFASINELRGYLEKGA